MPYVDSQTLVNRQRPDRGGGMGALNGVKSPGIGFQSSGRKANQLINQLGENDLSTKSTRQRYRKKNNANVGIANEAADLATGPAADAALAGANTAADYAGATAGGAANLANNVFLPGAKSLYDLGMDPQDELYNRNLQRLTEQQRVGQALRGVEMSPYGAGLENEALKNFNIDWENQALDRAVTGATGASNLATTGFNLGSDASKLAASGALLPYSTQLGFLNDEMTANNAGLSSIDRLLGYGPVANQTKQQQIGDYTGLAGMVPGYQAAQLAEDQQGFNQGMDIFDSITGLFGK